MAHRVGHLCRNTGPAIHATEPFAIVRQVPSANRGLMQQSVARNVAGFANSGGFSPSVCRGESLGFLGFDFRRTRSRRGVWWAQYTPKLKKCTALLQALKEVFRRHRSQPVTRVVQLINPVLRGWVNYFAVGHSSTCFQVIKRWVELKIRRHLMHARGRRDFGLAKWSTRWLYDNLGLFDNYRVRWVARKANPA